MKKIMKLTIFCLLLILVVYKVNAQNNYLEKLPPSVTATIKNNRFSEVNLLDAKIKKFKQYLYPFESFAQELPIESIKYSQTKSPFLFSEEEALEDIDFLFRLLKYGYAGYEFFGGDEKFNMINEKMINDIKKKSLFSKVLISSFKNILVQNLDFIQDGHFHIAGETFLDKYYYFTSPRFNFEKDEKGYYINFDGQRMYLLDVKGEDPEKYMKLSLNNNGEIIYRLGLISKQKYSNIHIKIKFITAGKIKTEDVVFFKEDSSVRGKKLPYGTSKVSGITVIEHKTARANPDNRKQLERFSKEAEKFRDEKILIIDLRGNSGGNSWYALKWVTNYSGITQGNSFIDGRLATRTSYQLMKNFISRTYDIDNPEEDPIYKKIFEITKSGWSEVRYSQPQKIENNNLILVLIDSHVASAGERFVSFLRQFENVIFIGVNTRGLVNTGNLGCCKLPNSKTSVFIPKDLELEPNFVLREGRGFNPDFWVKSEEALDKTVNFLKRYYLDS